MATVAWLTIAPVKGLGLVARDEIELERSGVADNRRFFLVDAKGRMTNAKRQGSLLAVRPEYDSATETLTLGFPDGTRVEGVVTTDGQVTIDFFGRPVRGRLVTGPWSKALLEHAGVELQLARVEDAGAGVDRGAGAAVTLLSRASLERLADSTGVETVDPRRFRMLIGIDGVSAHAEDEWIGRRVRVGEAIVIPRSHVGRCAVTTKDPVTGRPDLDTLKALAAYRPDGLEPLPFGVWGEVAEPGRIRLGDPVELLDE